MLCQCLHGQLNISFLFLKKIYLVVGLRCSMSALSLQLAGFSIVVELRLCSWEIGKSTRLNSSHSGQSRMPSSA